MATQRVLQCVFIAHPVDRTDRDGDFQVSVALAFGDSTTAEDVVRDALRHATGKLQATLEAPPQQMLVLVRFQRQLVRIPIGARLMSEAAFQAPVRAGDQPVLVLAPPGKISYVESLTKPQPQSGEEASPQGFASFVAHPGAAGLNRRVARGDSSPSLRAASPPQAPTADEPSPVLVRHASEKLLGATEGGGAPTQVEGGVPLVIRVIYHSMFGERSEVEVPYMSEDSADSVVAAATAAVSKMLRFPIPAGTAARMALFYRKKDGSERIFAGSDPLPLPKSATRTPTAYLGVRQDAPASPPHADAVPMSQASPARAAGGAEDSRLSAGAVDDTGLPDMCFDAAEAIREAYAAIVEDTRCARAAEKSKADAQSRRDELLRRRDGAQQRWTECAAVERDIERLSEQLEWFEREVSTQRDREAELRAKLHKLQSERRVVGS
uniref:Uncharacterized protein n=1 Tax=Neobodo designis TaxID=312471 RepID=A0A7S1MA71_NEODS